MNRFKGTQGQWKVSDVSKQKDWIGVATENRVVAICHNYDKEYQKYDAQLIATAPALLEVLIELVDMVDKAYSGYNNGELVVYDRDFDSARETISEALNIEK